MSFDLGTRPMDVVDKAVHLVESKEAMDITEVLDRNMPMSDVPLDTQSLDLDNELTVDALNNLVTEVDGEVVADYVIEDNGNQPDENLFVQGSDVMDVPAVNLLTAGMNFDPGATPDYGIRRRNDGALVKVTSTSLISGLTSSTQPSAETLQTLVVSMSDLENLTVVNVSDEFQHLTRGEPTHEPMSFVPCSLVGETSGSGMQQQLTIAPSTNIVQYYKCPNCDLLTATEELLVQHLTSSHGVVRTRASPCSTRPYKCEYDGCTWSFESKHRLNRHLKTHSAVKPFSCPREDCNSTFKTKSNLKTHLKVSHDPQLNKIACAVDGCEETFKFKKYMEEHVRQYHPDFRKLVCQEDGCNKEFFSEEDLNSHSVSHDRTFVCLVCGKRFQYESRFTEHVNMHNGIKPHKCAFQGCEWSFTTLSRLRRHERIHTDDRPFACHWEGCTSAFYRKEHLRAHIDSEHEQLKPFHCPVENCRSQFSSKSGLEPHLRKHFTPKTVYNCSFEACKKQCATEDTLRYHIQSHISQGDSRILKILELKNELNPDTLAGLRLAEKGQIPGRPRTLLPVVLSTLQSSGIKQPYQYLLQIAIEAAVKVQVRALDPATFSATPEDTAASTSVPTTSNTATASTSDSGNKLSVDILHVNVENGSARTDYIVNHLASEHARTRRRLMKENGTLEGVVSLQNLVRVRSLAQEAVEADEATDDVDDDSESGDAQRDFVAEIEDFNLHELLPAPDMTLRDPETGATYDQSQLLQDDEPPISTI